ncbi:MAG: SpoIIIAH-like family protein, partial [Lachnospiraceae bacterium]
MKNVLKKNQIMITALAIMIAVAGYLNFAGTKLSDEELLKVSGQSVVSENDEQIAEGEVLDELETFGDYGSASLEISDEDTD